MKKSRFTESQIMEILKQVEAGTPVADLCREHGVSTALVYRWRSKYGGMDTSMISRMKELESENTRLKKCMPKSVCRPILQRSFLEKSCKAIFKKGDGPKFG